MTEKSALLWYHDHAMGITRFNVYAGLTGLYSKSWIRLASRSQPRLLLS